MKYIVSCDQRIVLTEPEKTCAFPTYVKFTGPFTEENCSDFRQSLIRVENQAIESKQDVIPIVIDSYGGEVYSLLSAIDSIEDLKTRFTVATIVEGKAMSCGAFLFSCGTEGYRFMGPRATLMIHDAATMAFGKNEEIKMKVNECDRLNDLVFDLLADNCGKKRDYFRNLVYQNKHADLFLTANDCIKHNLANHIGIPKYEVEIRMETEFTW